jgi:hypothetical protein
MLSPRLIHSLVRRHLASILAALAVAASPVSTMAAQAGDPNWPREFDSPSGSFVIYQPQPEQLDGDVLTGRAAFSLQKTKDANPAYGVLWYTEQIAIDRDSSTVAARSLDVTKVRLPGITPEDASRYETLVETQAAGWDLSGSLEELQAGLAAAELERASVAGLDNAPPRILFHDRRAILVVYDGAPALEPIQGSRLQRVANTPYAVVFDPRARDYYLNGANLWYRASDPLGPWTDIQDPPTPIREIVPPDTSSTDQYEGMPPEVLTATEPTELIATDGPPRYAPLVEDELLYLTNTESDVIFEVSTQRLYVLISGRWFRAPSAGGPWTFVRGDQLPASFKRVPLDSPKGNILASVAGTDQAEDAVADAEIPQTSAIQRGDRSFQATYDGNPEFAAIEGTDLQYAMNTDAEVILADGRYYACDQGVWYISDYPEGPWSVSDTRPLGLENIPPSCPVYDARYVYIYDSTPDVVYEGYLPGYLGCYPYYGTVVYGTGYRYDARQRRDHYYPRRSTWGFHARYNPWLSRWSFGFSYGTGFLHVGTRWRSNPQISASSARSRWFGPGGYHRPLVARDMALLRTRPPGGVRPRVSDGLPANVYNRPETVARVDRAFDRIRVRSIASPIPRPMTRPIAQPIAPSVARPARVPDDVFAGKDGKVYRRDPKGGWQVNNGIAWRPTNLPKPRAVPATPPRQQRDNPRERPMPPRERPTPPRELPTPPSERPAPPPRERPMPPRERPTPPRERPTPPRERPTPPRERPTPQSERPTPPRERPAPPPEKSTPGDLEREYHARQRSDHQNDSNTPRNR